MKINTDKKIKLIKIFSQNKYLFLQRKSYNILLEISTIQGGEHDEKFVNV